jgi:hypothetical protein
VAEPCTSHPGFAFTRQPQLDDVANDWVIIRLEQPLEIRPIPLRALPSIGVTKEPEHEAADLEPEPDYEEDGPPVVIDLLRPKMVERRRAVSGCD